MIEKVKIICNLIVGEPRAEVEIADVIAILRSYEADRRRFPKNKDEVAAIFPDKMSPAAGISSKRRKYKHSLNRPHLYRLCKPLIEYFLIVSAPSPVSRLIRDVLWEFLTIRDNLGLVTCNTLSLSG